MAKALTKSQIAATLAENVGITKKQAVAVLEEVATLAYKNAKNTFTFPGVGKLVLVNRKARIGRNPATGAEIKIPAKKVVKFRVAKAAKDAILGAKAPDGARKSFCGSMRIRAERRGSGVIGFSPGARGSCGGCGPAPRGTACASGHPPWNAEIPPVMATMSIYPAIGPVMVGRSEPCQAV